MLFRRSMNDATSAGTRPFNVFVEKELLICASAPPSDLNRVLAPERRSTFRIVRQNCAILALSRDNGSPTTKGCFFKIICLPGSLEIC